MKLFIIVTILYWSGQTEIVKRPIPDNDMFICQMAGALASIDIKNDPSVKDLKFVCQYD